MNIKFIKLLGKKSYYLYALERKGKNNLSELKKWNKLSLNLIKNVREKLKTFNICSRNCLAKMVTLRLAMN